MLTKYGMRNAHWLSQRKIVYWLIHGHEWPIVNTKLKCINSFFLLTWGDVMSPLFCYLIQQLQKSMQRTHDWKENETIEYVDKNQQTNILRQPSLWFSCLATDSYNCPSLGSYWSDTSLAMIRRSVFSLSSKSEAFLRNKLTSLIPTSLDTYYATGY